jgi:hypothetical protein
MVMMVAAATASVVSVFFMVPPENGRPNAVMCY